MAQEIHKIRVLLAEQLSHSHGFNNLTEAKRILNKKIQNYQKIYKLRLVELDEHEKNEIEGLPNTFTPEDVQAKEQAIQEIKEKYKSIREENYIKQNEKFDLEELKDYLPAKNKFMSVTMRH